MGTVGIFKWMVSNFYLCGRHKAKGVKIYIECVLFDMFFSVIFILLFSELSTSLDVLV